MLIKKMKIIKNSNQQTLIAALRILWMTSSLLGIRDAVIVKDLNILEITL